MLFLAGTLSIVAFIVSGFFYNLYVGITFYIIALINAALEFYQEYQADRILKSFMKLVPDTALAIRDGATTPVNVDTLTRGDLVLLKMGDKVPADARLIMAQSMKLDLSSITGESEAADRDALTSPSDTDIRNASCIAFSGAKVMSGEGVGVVIRTGRPLPRALRAARPDLLPRTAAFGASGDVHDLTEERTLHLPHLAHATAHRTGVFAGAARAAAFAAGVVALEFDLFGHAGGDFPQLEGEGDLQILPARRTCRLAIRRYRQPRLVLELEV